MPMLLDIKKVLTTRSDRVKALDFHPTEPYVLAGLYNGQVKIWNYVDGSEVKSFDVSEVPVRAVKFIAKRNWFVAGSDDFMARVYSISTGERVHAWQPHEDYIRSITVHPTLPIILTASDDCTIKSWDWDKAWRCTQEYTGHNHYIMSLSINPKDPQIFASACLDHTIKVWSLGSPTPNFTLEDAHQKGVNSVDYYHGGDKPYLISCGDERTIKIWDYQNKSCVQTIDSPAANISFAVFHPSLPLIISGSEDGTVKLWNSSTYRLESTLSYGLERCWCVAYRKNGNEVALGYDEGLVVLKLGREEPSMSMDPAGKIVYAKNTEILTTNLQSVADDVVADGQRLALQPRELGTTDMLPQSLQHSPNGRFVTAVGDGEYIIYTSLAWRNKAFGTGTSFAWANDSNTYAVQESKNKIRVYRNFKERTGLIKGGSAGIAVEAVHGGTLLGARGSGYVLFWDWETGELVRRIEVEATSISWSGSGNLVAITSTDSLYLLQFDRDAYNEVLNSGVSIGDEGVEAAFDLINEVSENVKTVKWIGDCLLFTSSTNRLNYLIGEQVYTINHFDQPMYLLGYIPAHNRVYVADKDMGIFSFSLSLTLVEYQTAILRGDYDTANELLPTIPNDQRNKIARFLEAQDLKEMALQVATDPDQRFDLAVQLNDLDLALELVRAVPQVGSEGKWRIVGDKAMDAWRMDLAEECYGKAGDLAALLLIYTSMGDRAGLEKLAHSASKQGQHNIAFTCFHQLGDTAACIDLLVKTDRAPEAAFFARSYAPSSASSAVKSWKSQLTTGGKKKLADALADPEENEDLFDEGWAEALAKEQGSSSEAGAVLSGQNGASTSEQPAQAVTETISNGAEAVKDTVVDLAEKVKDVVIDAVEPAEAGEPNTESIEDDFVDAGAETTPTEEMAQAEAEIGTPAEDSSAKASAGGKKKKGKK